MPREERRYDVDLAAAEMDAMITALERKHLTQTEMVRFKDAMNRIRAAWCDCLKHEPVPEDEAERDALTVKRINRDPQSPFRGMVSMSARS